MSGRSTMSRLLLSAFVAATILSVAIAQKVAVDDLPFKNNHQRNLFYASKLYEAGEREVALETFRKMVAAYAAAGDMANKANTHEALAYLFYSKDKKWEAASRSIGEQKAWSLSRNLAAVRELTQFLKCFAKTDLTKRPRNDQRYDKNFRQIIKCFEENKAWTMALDWMDKYEAFRNPKSVTYDDRVDMIQYKKAEYYRLLRSLPEALVYYRQVAFGFRGDKQSKYAGEAFTKYKDLLKELKPRLYEKWVSAAKVRETEQDWEGAESALRYAKRYARSQGEHAKAVAAFKRRRETLLSKLLANVNASLGRAQWSIAKSALVDCLKLAGHRADLFSLYKACLLAERAEALAERRRYVEAADLFREAVALAEDKAPFRKREQEYESRVSKEFGERLEAVTKLVAKPTPNNMLKAWRTVAQLLDARPKHKAALSRAGEILSLRPDVLLRVFDRGVVPKGAKRRSMAFKAGNSYWYRQYYVHFQSFKINGHPMSNFVNSKTSYQGVVISGRQLPDTCTFVVDFTSEDPGKPVKFHASAEQYWHRTAHRKERTLRGPAGIVVKAIQTNDTLPVDREYCNNPISYLYVVCPPGLDEKAVKFRAQGHSCVLQIDKAVTPFRIYLSACDIAWPRFSKYIYDGLIR